VVHLQYPARGYGHGLGVTLFLAALAWLAPGIRRVLTLHEYASFTWRGRLRMRPMLRAAQVVVCTTHRDRRALRRTGRRARVVPLGSSVGPRAGEAWRPGPASEATAPVWLAHFGMAMPNKGWELLLAALQRLPERVGLRVAGELDLVREPYHRRVQTLIRKLGMEERVRFSGFQPWDRVGEVFRSTCGIAVLPYTGGASLNRSSLVACLAHGLAVITTRPLRPLEGLRHGEQVWYVEPRPEALAAAVADLLADPARAARLRAGALRAARRHAWPRLASAHQAVYADILRGEA
jgi:glycosyltransferase involved in cell wall biosynthesis